MKRPLGMRDPDESYPNLGEMELLNALSVGLLQSLSLSELVETALDLVWSGLGATGVGLSLSEWGTSKMVGIKGRFPYALGDRAGLSREVEATGRTICFSTFSQDGFPDASRYRHLGIVAVAGIPVTGRQGLLGVLEVIFDQARRFTDRDRQLMAELGNLIGLGIQNARQYEEASSRARRYIAISRAISVTRQVGTLEEVMLDFSRVLVQSFGFDRSWIGLLDPDGLHLVGIAGFGAGVRPEDRNRVFPVFDASSHPAVQAVRSGEAVVLSNPTLDQAHDTMGEGTVSSLAYVPIPHGDRAIGVVGVMNLSPTPIEEEDIKALARVAEQASTMIEHIRFYEALKRSEERYRTLFESTASGLAILDSDLRLKLVNRSFENLTGYRHTELIAGMSIERFFPRGGDRSALLEKIHHPPQQFETEFVDREGRKHHIHIAVTRIPSSSDLLLSIVDMTRERDLERRLFKSEELAAIGELSAGIAHEIRNPLISIKNAVSLLKEEAHLSGEGRQLLQVMKEETDHLAAIVEDFLQFARPKKPTLIKEDLNQLLHEAVKRCQEWNGKEVTWIESYGESLPKIPLDRHQIHQVVTNVLMNALDAVPVGGRIEIRSRLIKSRKNPCIEVTVSDNGIGIPSRNLKKIFQPFFSTKDQGTGMGLAICRRIMEEHRGEIGVVSREGEGATFYLRFRLDADTKTSSQSE